MSTRQLDERQLWNDLLELGSSQYIDMTNASKQSAAIPTDTVTVFPEEDCYIVYGADPTATIPAVEQTRSAVHFLAGGIEVSFKIAVNDKIAVIRSVSGGKLYIKESAYNENYYPRT